MLQDYTANYRNSFSVLKKIYFNMYVSKIFSIYCMAGLANIGCIVPKLILYIFGWDVVSIFSISPHSLDQAVFLLASLIHIRHIRAKKKMYATLQNFLFLEFIWHNRIQIHLFPERNSCHSSWWIPQPFTFIPGF